MSIHMIRDLDSLHRKVLTMCGHVEEMIHEAVDTLHSPQFQKARDIVTKDDAIDEMDVQIEEECLKLLALHQPVAIDLRRITTVMKISAELERVADLGVNIAERACGIGQHHTFEARANLLFGREERIAEQRITRLEKVQELRRGAAPARGQARTLGRVVRTPPDFFVERIRDERGRVVPVLDRGRTHEARDLSRLENAEAAEEQDRKADTENREHFRLG